MKKFLFTCLLSHFIGFSQHNAKEIEVVQDNSVFNIESLDKYPSYRDCQHLSKNEALKNCFEEKIKNHIKQNLIYQKEALTKMIQGQVVIEITIEESGAINEYKLLSSAHPLLDKEAMRVAKLIPNMKPGMIKGKAVRTIYKIPFNFKL